MSGLPDVLRVNAWSGAESPSAQLNDGSLKWGLRQRVEGPSAAEALLGRGPAPLVSESDWRNPGIGWGLVLPENTALPEKDRATAVDAPPEIRELVRARGDAPVLRYLSDHQSGFLRRYFSDGTHQDPSLAGSIPGTQRGQLPRYLLIYASPAHIPWRFQYVANSSLYVGRLWLEGEALRNYVSALIDDWSDAVSNPNAPVVWSVNLGQPDITWLMDAVISKKLSGAFARGELTDGATCFDGDATAATLGAKLAKHTPSLVVTTSHGMTGPVGDPALMQNDLGLLVDVDHALVRPAALFDAGWKPNGAIWYAHACCSAGSDVASRYVGLLDAGSPVSSVLSAVALACGDRIAPLPSTLLGAKRPLRAFVGHVEPTFDWTLRNPENGQPLAHAIVQALYDRLYQQAPRITLGHALSNVYAEAGSFLTQYQAALDAVNRSEPLARQRALYRQLVAMDRQQMVILGDPTVMLPPLVP